MNFKPTRMRLVFTLTFLTVTMNSSTSISSQRTDKPQRTSGDVEREILAVDEERDQALRHNDVQALARLYSDDFMMITAAGEIRTKQDQLRDISAGTIQHQGPSTRILKLREYGDVAVVQSESQGGTLIMNGRADANVRRFTRVYVKTDGKWQLVATHISRVETKK